MPCSVVLVNMLAMSNFHNRYKQTLIHHFIDNSIYTLADAVSFLSGKFFTASRARIILQCIYTLEKAGNVFVRN